MAVKLVKKAFGGELIFCVFINNGRKGDGKFAYLEFIRITKSTIRPFHLKSKMFLPIRTNFL